MSTTTMPCEFQVMLRGFDEIIEGSPDPLTVKKELDELKEAANLSAELTGAQRSAIVERCNNYLKGEYRSKSNGYKAPISVVK